MRTLVSSNGHRVETDLTDSQAIAILVTVRTKFAQDLASKPSLSNNQMVWVHKIAIEHRNGKKAAPIAAQIDNFKGIVALFEAAKRHLKNPKIHLQDGEGVHIALSLAKANSRNPGCIYITNGGGWGNQVFYGKVTPAGDFVATDKCPASVAPYLQKFAQNPAHEAAEYGKLTGNCCFCSRPLSDERSTEVGYGPVCAEHYELPWGNRRVVDPSQVVMPLEADSPETARAYLHVDAVRLTAGGYVPA